MMRHAGRGHTNLEAWRNPHGHSWQYDSSYIQVSERLQFSQEFDGFSTGETYKLLLKHANSAETFLRGIKCLKITYYV